MWGWWQEQEEDGYDNDNSNSYSFAILDRILAGGEGDDGGVGGNSTNNDPYADPYAVLPLDYTILSYGIATLYLILIVESIRHYIDHAAHGRPFFKAVLLTAYSECKYVCTAHGTYVMFLDNACISSFFVFNLHTLAPTLTLTLFKYIMPPSYRSLFFLLCPLF